MICDENEFRSNIRSTTMAFHASFMIEKGILGVGRREKGLCEGMEPDLMDGL